VYVRSEIMFWFPRFSFSFDVDVVVGSCSRSSVYLPTCMLRLLEIASLRFLNAMSAAELM